MLRRAFSFGSSHLGRGGAAGGSGTPEKNIAVDIRNVSFSKRPENERGQEGANRPDLDVKPDTAR